MRPEVLVIGIGNEYRNDDGIGILVARMLQEKRIPTLAVKEESGEGTALLTVWQEFSRVILVDAVCSGASPGTIHRMVTQEKTLLHRMFRHSTHAFGVAEAIELARVLNTLPQQLIIFGIEGKEFSSGQKITPAVKDAAKKVIDQILETLSLPSSSTS